MIIKIVGLGLISDLCSYFSIITFEAGLTQIRSIVGSNRRRAGFNKIEKNREELVFFFSVPEVDLIELETDSSSQKSAKDFFSKMFF